MNVGLLDKYKELTDSKTWSSRSVDPGKESTVLHNLDAVTSNKLIQLVWEGISNQIKNENENLTILENINGFANPGELTIIMGSSGAGKTSLLNIIAGRALQNTKHIVTGSVKANGIPIDQINYKKFSAFITQEDMLLPYLTVRETFLYAAKLKIDGTNQDIEEKVDKLIYELRLANIADNLIGNVILKGISGGEKKRVSIGVELISDPQIIILDEPTSGLDSFTADMVIDILHRQTRIGKTVLLTVHQPSSSIYRKFDTLILLSEGQMMYHGQSKKSRKYFNELGYKCPNMVNPPDYYMKLLFISNRYLKTDSEKQTLKVLTEQFNKNPPKAVLNKN